jgi:hypothetical protein
MAWFWRLHHRLFHQSERGHDCRATRGESGPPWLTRRDVVWLVLIDGCMLGASAAALWDNMLGDGAWWRVLAAAAYLFFAACATSNILDLAHQRYHYRQASQVLDEITREADEHLAFLRHARMMIHD